MFDEGKLKQIFASVLKINPDLVNDSISVDNIDSWDSIAHMNLVLVIESEFQIQIPDEEVGQITSFKLTRLVVSELLS